MSMTHFYRSITQCNFPSAASSPSETRGMSPSVSSLPRQLLRSSTYAKSACSSFWSLPSLSGSQFPDLKLLQVRHEPITSVQKFHKYRKLIQNLRSRFLLQYPLISAIDNDVVGRMAGNFLNKCCPIF